jgi:hypothetical protein
MTQEFVPYELAVKLKQLGFDEPCFGFYYDDGELQIKEGNHNTLGYLNAPTFGQVFRWFRQEHLVVGVVDGVGSRQYFNIRSDKFNVIHSKLVYEEYEEAEIDCLKMLIDIIAKELNQSK